MVNVYLLGLMVLGVALVLALIVLRVNRRAKAEGAAIALPAAPEAGAPDAGEPASIEPPAAEAAAVAPVPEVAAEAAANPDETPAPSRRRRIIPASEQAGLQAAAAEHRSAAADHTLYQLVEAHLEAAFNQFCDGQITLDAYAAKVRAERELALQQLADLNPAYGGAADVPGASALPEARADAEAALEAIEWCLQWAEDRRAA